MMATHPKTQQEKGSEVRDPDTPLGKGLSFLSALVPMPAKAKSQKKILALSHTICHRSWAIHLWKGHQHVDAAPHLSNMKKCGQKRQLSG